MKCWLFGCCEDVRYKILEIINKERKKKLKLFFLGFLDYFFFLGCWYIMFIIGVYLILEFYKYMIYFKFKYLYLYYC